MREYFDIEFFTSKYNKEEEFVEGKIRLNKKISDKEFLKFLYWIWLSKSNFTELFKYEENIWQKFPSLKYAEGNFKITFIGKEINSGWNLLEKKEIEEMINSIENLNILYEEYLKEKDNYDFFVKLYINALAGSQEAFKGFLLLDNLETVDRFSATHDFINDKTTVYKLPNNEFFAEHFSRKFDLYDDTFETEYKEFYFVIPEEKTITEWKKEH